nr:hypothetical protein BaRGS_016328 [Batillaria attramentaria]
MDSWARVHVPPGHGLMLSYPRMNLTGPRDQCKWGACALQHVITYSWQEEYRCTQFLRPGSSIYNDTSALLVHFTSQTSDPLTGFRMYFTFHNYSAFPQRLENGVWNCSVPYWPDFRHHEPCDLTLDCDQGQDEADCPYTSERCGVGFMDAGGSCFQYVISPVRNVVWNDIDYVCQQRGGRLANFNTPDKWNRIMEFLQLRKDVRPFDHCADGSDEGRCSKPPHWGLVVRTPPPPAVVDLDGTWNFTVRAFSTQPRDSGAIQCPDTHYQCHDNGYCLPVFTRCNSVYDCPGKEDEAECDSYTCPGLYRCRASLVCLHPDHVCDGVFQCPLFDDELLCDLNCPENCTCYGMAFICHGTFPADSHADLRYLDARGTGMNPADLTENSLLVHLNLADCDVASLHNLSLPNLQVLDLSDNSLAEVSLHDLSRVPQLKVLSLAGNPLTALFSSQKTGQSMALMHLRALDLSRVPLLELDVSVLVHVPNLRVLNMSETGLDIIKDPGFRVLKQLRTLDLQGCPVSVFPRGVLQGLDKLNAIDADNYKFCCPATLPEGFMETSCRAPSDEVSSCDALLRSDIYRIFLSVLAALALFGNLSSFVYRTFLQKTKSSLGFDAFVTHLCVSDFLMGVYLAMVAFNICLITLDRFLVLRFPFSEFHFRKWSAHVACVVFWFFGLLLAAIPLLPMTSHWDFYGQTGICIPLPITRNDFAGHDYSFGVMIVLNFVLFLFIAAGQAFIYWSIHVNSMSASDSTKKSNDLTIARRLITIAVSDFLCWFPIGLLGLLASTGVAVPGEVSVAMAILVLPLNSALNPFLYTINVILERRRREQDNGYGKCSCRR